MEKNNSLIEEKMNEIMWKMEENNEKDIKKTVIKIWENNGIKYWKIESSIKIIRLFWIM